MPSGTGVPPVYGGDTPVSKTNYLRVYGKLTSGLKLPFAYQSPPTVGASLFADPVRSGQSPVHEAVQEALVNSLIHADYQGQGGIVIEQFRDRIELSNPGRLLISIVQLMKGGVSECRNESLQTMFRMIGAGDEAGSGIDKIRTGWQSQRWRSPSVEPSIDPDRVQLNLPMVSLIPAESQARLRQIFGTDLDALTPLEVQTLVTADLEGEVSNSRLQLFAEEHPTELTRILQNLTAQGFLEKFGQKRQTYYRLPEWLAPPTSGATPPTDEALIAIAQPARDKLRLAPELTKTIVRNLCDGVYLSAARIADLLHREPEKLRERILNPLVADGQLVLRFPNEPNHPQQAYSAAPKVGQ